MKNLILSALLIMASFSLATAQESNSSSFNPWQFRLRAVVVSPDESASIGTIGGDVDISTTVIPELDITYFFTRNWAAELILGTTKHKVEATNTAAGNIDLGDVWLLPPTLTLQYHLTKWEKFKPYIGAGVNYTIFYNADEGPVADKVEYDNAFGFATQLGLDYMISDKWFINLDIKKIFLQTDVTVNANTALGATVPADVDINPWLIGLGIGVKL
ncbi:OmpW family protein [Sinomicrobium pectinilyticum]|uniref:OmpW family protein n=1 Tax=Sinomicrobium pectinilyticum TaxID=1084421 RepID=A0A3N0ELX5_SINP1|nr:OmpW family outer membrane protein [Sinomicrobium pectinilyticum]RNL88669.1 OmpW family protein [Sinomicrobium pectinilyticum]